MDGLLALIIIFAILGGAGAAAGSALLIAIPDRPRRQALPWVISYATGTLLAAAFLGMIPQALAAAPVRPVCATLLAGVVGFFVLEKTMIWRHGHSREDAPRGGSAGRLILIGDGLHNFVDGVVIAAAFLSSIPLGVAVGLAVIAHEAPQEVGDFAILLDSGFSQRKAFALNTLSAMATLPGALLGYFWLPELVEAIPFVMAVSAASFIYIATADLIPMLHKGVSPRGAAGQLGLLLSGVATIALLQACL